MYFRHEQLTATGSITVHCRLFARYAEITGISEVTLELPRSSTVADAVRFLRARAPGAAIIPERPLVALNQVHALPNEELHDGDELALLPPVAGG